MMRFLLWPALVVLLLAADWWAIDHVPSRTAEPEPEPAVVEPELTRCLQCPRPIPSGATWCDWGCRNLDDRHDDGDADE